MVENRQTFNLSHGEHNIPLFKTDEEFYAYARPVDGCGQIRNRWNVLVAVMSLGCLVCGVGFAGLSLRDPLRAPAFERWSGVCLVLGLCLLGAAIQGAG